MDTKTKIKLFLIQLVILAFFAFLAFGSGEADKQVARGALQGGTCGALGYTYIGSYSDCGSACAARGYDSYCIGDATTACFCK